MGFLIESTVLIKIGKNFVAFVFKMKILSINFSSIRNLSKNIKSNQQREIFLPTFVLIIQEN